MQYCGRCYHSTHHNTHYLWKHNQTKSIMEVSVVQKLSLETSAFQTCSMTVCVAIAGFCSEHCNITGRQWLYHVLVCVPQCWFRPFHFLLFQPACFCLMFSQVIPYNYLRWRTLNDDANTENTRPAQCVFLCLLRRSVCTIYNNESKPTSPPFRLIETIQTWPSIA